jgi:hypothetical protein
MDGQKLWATKDINTWRTQVQNLPLQDGYNKLWNILCHGFCPVAVPKHWAEFRIYEAEITVARNKNKITQHLIKSYVLTDSGTGYILEESKVL